MKPEVTNTNDQNSMLQFDDVTVMPSQDRRGPLVRGGPIWPNWDDQSLARHCRSRIPVDARPDDPSTSAILKLESGIWVGPIYWHFGHQIAEFSARILQSMQERDSDKFIFGVMPQLVGKTSWENLPASFKAIASWYGVTSDMVLLCHEPMLVHKLRVAPPGEQMGRVEPTEKYLDLLDANWLSKKVTPIQNDIVYVSRAKLKAQFGGHAGAAYLDEVLVKAGIEVIHPETLDLVEQLRIYKGANTLIFSEGSALHGVQLLGRGLGNIAVFNRRQVNAIRQRKMASPQITPRCQTLTYFNVVAHQLALYGLDWQILENSAIALFDVDRLLQSFAEVGVNLAQHWNNEKFLKQQNEDLRRWIVACWRRKGGRLDIAMQERLIADLESANLGELGDYFREIMVKG